MRNLFPVIPHYWIERRSIILPIGLGLRAVAQWVTILSSPWWVGVENNTQRYLYYDFFTIMSMSKNTQ